MLSDALKARADAHREVLLSCLSLLKGLNLCFLFQLMFVFLPQMLPARFAHPHPPEPTGIPPPPLACLVSDKDLEKMHSFPAPPTPALSSFLSQKALQSVAEGSAAPHTSKKEKNRKEHQLSDLQVQSGSHRSTFSQLLWLTLFFHHTGKEHSSGTDALV